MNDKHFNKSIDELHAILCQITIDAKALDKQILEYNPVWINNHFDYTKLDEMFKCDRKLNIKWRYFTAIYLLKLWGKDYDLHFIRNFHKY